MKREIQPHRFNNGFTWKPVPRLGGLATPSECDAFDRDGFVLVERHSTPTRSPPPERKSTPSRRRSGPARTRRRRLRHLRGRRHHLHREDRRPVRHAQALRHPGGVRTARRRLRRSGSAHLLGPGRLQAARAGREFPWHQDTGYTFTLPQHYLTCWTPLVDATLDNGCPWVSPRPPPPGHAEALVDRRRMALRRRDDRTAEPYRSKPRSATSSASRR